ncbi:endonuclease [Gynuella sp.]|uniref:endonuclease n=1 Tax=Gynuella sp. TaxID=2969146 RepID=UPI003D0D9318
MQKLLLTGCLISATTFAFAEHANSFSEAKKIASSIHADEHQTFYCGCDFKDNTILPSNCGYQPRKQPERGARLEWEHVVPAWEFGHQRQCWQNGGRARCTSTDHYFNIMESDLHNLVPAVGELNGDRSNFRYGIIQGEPRAYGQCNFEVDFKSHRAEPPEDRQGDVARIYFYMRDRYGLKISRQQTQLFDAWSKLDPVDEDEKQLNTRILNIQGNSNCYVSTDCTVEKISEEEQTLTSSSDENQCQPEIHTCSQMKSCAQAKYYLNQCGLSSLDRNKDGIPCESLCKP